MLFVWEKVKMVRRVKKGENIERSLTYKYMCIESSITSPYLFGITIV